MRILDLLKSIMSKTAMPRKIKLEQIIIKESFKNTRVRKHKWAAKWKYFNEYGKCESKIILDKNNVLIDGYTSYLIYKIKYGTSAKVPVYYE